jgi:hypothetical protein
MKGDKIMTYSILLAIPRPDKSQSADHYAKWEGFVKNLKDHGADLGDVVD